MVSIMNAKRFVVAAALLALSYGGALADAAGPIQWQQVPSSSSCSPVFNTTTGAVTCSAGSGGITALTGDVTASGTGSVAATVVSIGGKTVSLGGTFTISGAFNTTLTVTGATNVTLPTSGTLINTSALPSAGGTQLYVGTGAAGAAAALAASGGGTTNFLRADMTWAAPAGGPCGVGTGTLSILCSGGSGGANTAGGTNTGVFAGDSNSTGTGTNNAIAGGHGNTINNSNAYGFIGGGSGNSIAGSGNYNAILSGTGNQINGASSTVVGGNTNITDCTYNSLFGSNNTSNSGYAFIAGGSNTVNDGCVASGGAIGQSNSVTGDGYAFALGLSNTVSGFSGLALNQNNTVSGSASLAAGSFAKDHGATAAFVFGGAGMGRGNLNSLNQNGQYTAWCEMNSSTVCQLKDNSGNILKLDTDYLGYNFRVEMIAVDRTASGHAFGTWNLANSLIYRQSGAASVAMGVGNPIFIAGATGGTFPTNTVPTISADTSTGGLILNGPTVAGNTHDIWVSAKISTTEISGNF